MARKLALEAQDGCKDGRRVGGVGGEEGAGKGEEIERIWGRLWWESRGN